MAPRVISFLPGFYAHGKEIPRLTTVHATEARTKDGVLLAVFTQDKWIVTGNGNVGLEPFNNKLTINHKAFYPGHVTGGSNRGAPEIEEDIYDIETIIVQ